MSVHVVPVAPSPLDYGTALRLPVQTVAVEGGYSLTFEPDLSPAEVATLDLIVSAISATVAITPAELDAIRPNLQALRDLRQLGRAAFLDLTAAERDRRLYDAQTDTTIILLALLRS